MYLLRIRLGRAVPAAIAGLVLVSSAVLAISDIAGQRQLNSLISLYDNVVWDGVTFNGHWSWIYTAHNDPSTPDGQHLWQWMAEQTR